MRCDARRMSEMAVMSDPIDGFEVRLHRSGRTIIVPTGETILDVLLDAGINITFSCTEGHCGTCETRVIDGIPDHHDTYLSDEEKAENSKIMICCSRSKSPVLTLDL
jgi:vanillate O-demethylase ferredoxin subunit